MDSFAELLPQRERQVFSVMHKRTKVKSTCASWQILLWLCIRFNIYHKPAHSANEAVALCMDFFRGFPRHLLFF